MLMVSMLPPMSWANPPVSALLMLNLSKFRNINMNMIYGCNVGRGFEVRGGVISHRGGVWCVGKTYQEVEVEVLNERLLFLDRPLQVGHPAGVVRVCIE